MILPCLPFGPTAPFRVPVSDMAFRDCPVELDEFRPFPFDPPARLLRAFHVVEGVEPSVVRGELHHHMHVVVAVPA